MDIKRRPLVGLGVVISNPHRHILLGKRKNSHGEASWGPPGGHLEFGESFEACAVREVLEETGLRIENPTFLALDNSFFKEEKKHYVSILMKADYPTGQVLQNCEPHKVEEWSWFSPASLPSPLFLPLRQLFSSHTYPQGEKMLFQEERKESIKIHP